jgi:site-specific DNA recombinase
MQKSQNAKLFFAYIRVSTPKQGIEGVSLEAQRRAIEEHAARHGLQVSRWFEERETAAKRGRPIFFEMLKLLRKGMARGVIIHKIDRSARNLKDWADLGELIDRGVEVHFATENYDLRSRGGRLSADIQAVVAADYIRNLREEVRKGILGRLRQGRYPRPAPVGYLNKGKGIKEIDPVQGPLVRQCFGLYATGEWPLLKLIPEMQRRGLRNTRGGQLSLNGMSKLLNNPFYTGMIHVKCTKEVFTGTHQALISKALFDRVQMILQGKLADREHRHSFVFSRLLKCTECAYHLTGEMQKGHTYYRCHIPTCPQKTIREKEVEKALLGKFATIWFPRRAEMFFRKRYEEFLENIGSAQQEQLKSLRLRLDQTSAQLLRLADGYSEGILAAEVVKEKQNILLTDKKDIEEQLQRLRASEKRVMAERMEKFFEQAKSAVESYKAGFPEEKRSLVRTMTSNLSVHQKNVSIMLDLPFSDFEKCPKNFSGGPDRGVLRTWDRLLERLYQHCLEDPAFPLEPELAR